MSSLKDSQIQKLKRQVQELRKKNQEQKIQLGQIRAQNKEKGEKFTNALKNSFQLFKKGQYNKALSEICSIQQGQAKQGIRHWILSILDWIKQNPGKTILIVLLILGSIAFGVGIWKAGWFVFKDSILQFASNLIQKVFNVAKTLCQSLYSLFKKGMSLLDL